MASFIFFPKQVYLRMNPHCSNSSSALLKISLSASFVFSSSSALIMPVFFVESALIIVIWTVGFLKSLSIPIHKQPKKIIESSGNPFIFYRFPPNSAFSIGSKNSINITKRALRPFCFSHFLQ